MINTKTLDALGDNWLLRTDFDGRSFGGFKSAPVGEWTKCPKWGTWTRADCSSGGLFGQGPGGFGAAVSGTRLVFAETRGERICVSGDKIKVPEFRILYTGLDAWQAALHCCGGLWPGDLYLQGCTLPAEFVVNVLGNVRFTKVTLDRTVAFNLIGGSCTLLWCRLPAPFIVRQVNKDFLMNNCPVPGPFQLGILAGNLYMEKSPVKGKFTIEHIAGQTMIF